jgi:capsular polysaccharide transport system permease protein
MADAPIPPSDTYTPAAPLAPKKQGRRLRTISALILREMQARYGNSPGGYIWAVLEPVGQLLLMSLLFSFLVRSPSLGNSFILFYATGLLPFGLYNSIANVTTQALNYSRPLLTYPVVMWIDAVYARLILTVLTEVIVAYILLFTFLTIYDTGAILDFIPIMAAYCGAILLGLGVGLVNTVIIGFFPVWQAFWAILTRPLFLISGVIFIMEDLPPAAQEVLKWNPVMHITGSMREGFYPMYKPQYISYTFVFMTALILVFAGTLLMRRFHRDFLKK